MLRRCIKLSPSPKKSDINSTFTCYIYSNKCQCFNLECTDFLIGNPACMYDPSARLYLLYRQKVSFDITIVPSDAKLLKIMSVKSSISVIL